MSKNKFCSAVWSSLSISYLLLFFFGGLGTFWVAIGHLVGSRQNQALAAHFLWLEQQPSGTVGRGFEEFEFPPLFELLGLFCFGGLEDLTADTSAAPAALGGFAGVTIAATLADMSVVWVLK